MGAKSVFELVITSIKNGQGGKQAAQELKELKGTVGEVTSGLLGFNLGSLTAAGSVVALGGMVKQAADFAIEAVQNYQAYGEKIRGMAAITGTGVEETSRLVQALDDLGVKQEQVNTVIESAAKKGFVFSIDNVSKLADEFNGLSTQEEKNKLLTDKLGKSGYDMAKAFDAGGQAIRDAAAAQADGMIITQKQMDQLELLRKQQDDLGDSATNLWNILAKGLVPATLDFTNVLIGLTDGEYKLTDFLAGKGIIQMAVHEKQMRQVKEAGLELLDITGPLTEGIAGYSGELETRANPALKAAASGWDALPPSMQAYITKADEAAAATEKMKQPIDDLKTAIDDLDKARQSFGQGVAGQIKSGLEASGLSGDALNQALLAVDQQLGTNTFNEQQLQNWIANIVNRYSTGAGLGDLNSSLGNLRNTMMPLDPGVAAAQGNVVEKANAMINIGPIYVGNDMDYQTLLARLKYDLPGILG